jgi:hypothetical protein
MWIASKMKQKWLEIGMSEYDSDAINKEKFAWHT